jgi:hypothetical protein
MWKRSLWLTPNWSVCGLHNRLQPSKFPWLLFKLSSDPPQRGRQNQDILYHSVDISKGYTMVSIFLMWAQRWSVHWWRGRKDGKMRESSLTWKRPSTTWENSKWSWTLRRVHSVCPPENYSGIWSPIAELTLTQRIEPPWRPEVDGVHGYLEQIHLGTQCHGTPFL